MRIRLRSVVCVLSLLALTDDVAAQYGGGVIRRANEKYYGRNAGPRTPAYTGSYADKSPVERADIDSSRRPEALRPAVKTPTVGEAEPTKPPPVRQEEEGPGDLGEKAAAVRATHLKLLEELKSNREALRAQIVDFEPPPRFEAVAEAGRLKVLCAYLSGLEKLGDTILERQDAFRATVINFKKAEREAPEAYMKLARYFRQRAAEMDPTFKDVIGRYERHALWYEARAKRILDQAKKITLPADYDNERKHIEACQAFIRDARLACEKDPFTFHDDAPLIEAIRGYVMEYQALGSTLDQWLEKLESKASAESQGSGDPPVQPAATPPPPPGRESKPPTTSAATDSTRLDLFDEFGGEAEANPGDSIERRVEGGLGRPAVASRSGPGGPRA